MYAHTSHARVKTTMATGEVSVYREEISKTCLLFCRKKILLENWYQIVLRNETRLVFNRVIYPGKLPLFTNPRNLNSHSFIDEREIYVRITTGSFYYFTTIKKILPFQLEQKREVKALQSQPYSSCYEETFALHPKPTVCFILQNC